MSSTAHVEYRQRLPATAAKQFAHGRRRSRAFNQPAMSPKVIEALVFQLKSPRSSSLPCFRQD